MEIVAPVGRISRRRAINRGERIEHGRYACELFRGQAAAGREALHQGGGITDKRRRGGQRGGRFNGGRGLLHPVTGARKGIGRERHAAAFLRPRDQFLGQVDAGRPEVGGGFTNKRAVIGVLAGVAQG